MRCRPIRSEREASSGESRGMRGSVLVKIDRRKTVNPPMGTMDRAPQTGVRAIDLTERALPLVIRAVEMTKRTLLSIPPISGSVPMGGRGRT